MSEIENAIKDTTALKVLAIDEQARLHWWYIKSNIEEWHYCSCTVCYNNILDTAIHLTIWGKAIIYPIKKITGVFHYCHVSVTFSWKLLTID